MIFGIAAKCVCSHSLAQSFDKASILLDWFAIHVIPFPVNTKLIAPQMRWWDILRLRSITEAWTNPDYSDYTYYFISIRHTHTHTRHTLTLSSMLRITNENCGSVVLTAKMNVICQSMASYNGADTDFKLSSTVVISAIRCANMANDLIKHSNPIGRKSTVKCFKCDGEFGRLCK